MVFSIVLGILIAWFIIELLKEANNEFQNNRAFGSHKILVGVAIFVLFIVYKLS